MKINNKENFKKIETLRREEIEKKRIHGYKIENVLPFVKKKEILFESIFN